MPSLEVADIFRAHGPTMASRCAGSTSDLGQLKVMSRRSSSVRPSAALGWPLRCAVQRAPQPARSPTTRVATDTARSARVIELPRSAGSKHDRRTSCLVPYYHLVFTLPAPRSAPSPTPNKETLYALLFRHRRRDACATDRRRSEATWAPGSAPL